MAKSNQKPAKKTPNVSKANEERSLAAKPKPRSSGTFKPGGELAATIK